MRVADVSSKVLQHPDHLDQFRRVHGNVLLKIDPHSQISERYPRGRYTTLVENTVLVSLLLRKGRVFAT